MDAERPVERRAPGRLARAARPDPPRRERRPVARAIGLVMLAGLAASVLIPAFLPPPAAVGMAFPARAVTAPRYLVDDSGIDAAGERQLTQSIFDEVLAMIETAEYLVHLDMFLYNDWQGSEPETTRALADDLTEALIARLGERPELVVNVVTDPINTVYGGLRSPRFEALRDAGANVVVTDLAELQDSNRLWSGFWRVFVQPFGNATGGGLPNPLGPGQVTLRSWLALFNFKANHRKLVVADAAGGALRALVTSANPHDGSSAHRNTALAFGGAAARDLLASERALLAMSGADEAIERLDRALAAMPAGPATDDPAAGDGATGAAPAGPTIQVLGERRIEDAALDMLGEARAGDRVDLAMFYLADRDVIGALLAARERGAEVRVLLDGNRDAFGRAKNGVPNLPVAAELVDADVAVRWCATGGEQCHAKQLYVETGDAQTLLLGSGNFTRRNLHDLNLETDVRLVVPAVTPASGSGGNSTMIGVREHFDRLWNNTGAVTYSLDYETHVDESPWLRLQYRVMEATGLSTF